MYYLQSRYYNPEWGRFINADAFASTGQGFVGNNMFAYCNNNPVVFFDPSGTLCAYNLQMTDTGGKYPRPFGAATQYRPTNSSEYNCFAYALGETERRNVGGDRNLDSFDVYDIANIVVEDVTNLGRSIRIIESYDSPIAENEYRIAMRTGVDEYHFMKQHNDGSWSHKPGRCKSRLIERPDPGAVSWDRPLYDRIRWDARRVVYEVGSQPNYYYSDTVYFAITR